MDKDQKPGLAIVFLASAASVALLYLLFFSLSYLIWRVSPLDPLAFTPWMRKFLAERDGLEPYALYVLSLASLPLSYAVFSLLKRRALQRFILPIIAFLAVVLYFKTGFIIPMSMDNGSNLLMFMPATFWLGLRVLLFLAAFILAEKYIPKASPYIIAVALIPVCFIPVFLFSPYDYNYIFMPALKILQGFKLSSIYFQYDMLLSLVAGAWIRLKMNFAHFYILGEACYWAMFLCLYLVSRKFFKDRFLPVIMVFSMVMFRIYAIALDPVSFFQVTPLRLDLWLPLFISTLAFGPYSFITGLALGATIILSATFGAIYAASYLELAALLFILDAVRPGAFKSSLAAHLKLNLTNFAIIISSFIIHAVLTGGFASEAASMYSSASIAFSKISQRSFYWQFAVAQAAAFCLLMLYRNESKEKYFQSGIFLILLASGTLMYFFGMSHENNIINVSTPLIFVLFMALDLSASASFEIREKTSRAISRAAALFVIPAVFIVSIPLSSSRELDAKFSLQFSRLISGQYLKASAPKNIPDNAAKIKEMTGGSDKVYISSRDNEFLYYYLGGYKAISRYTPSSAWIDNKGFNKLVKELLDEGYYIVTDMPENFKEALSNAGMLKTTSHNGLVFYHKQ